MDIEIRSMAPNERMEVIKLAERTARSKFVDFLGKETVDRYIGSGAVGGYFIEHCEATEILTLDCRIVGIIVMKEKAIDLLMVDARHHGKGFGTRLLRHGEERLFQRNDRIRVDSFRDNTNANEFYRSQGWTGGSEFFDPEYGVPMIRFTKMRDTSGSSDIGN